MPSKASSTRVLVRSVHGPHGVDRAALRRCGARMLLALDRANAELSIVLIDEASMRDLNRHFRKVDAPTDVLSFSMSEGADGSVSPHLLGDVVICVPVARRRASRARKRLIDEVTHLLAHGLLHLLGFDHETDTQDRRMKRETVRLAQAARGDRKT
jgi:probable rRNA maturation factor